MDEKNIILKRAELMELLADTVNNADLPAFVIRGVLDDLRETMMQIEAAEYRDAIAELTVKTITVGGDRR